jgi:polyisoprenoid-binding protein YceI
MGIAHNLVRSASRFRWPRAAALAVVVGAAISVSAQPATLEIDLSKTSVKFSLDAALHSVHGTFQAQPGALEFDPASGQISGQIIVDAKSGQTGNALRDRKMNSDVLESDRYPQIVFRPLRVDGAVSNPGKSSVSVRGVFHIHGADREITVPAQVEIDADHWTAWAHFTVPYANWGMKNPSTLFLRVSDSVEIDLVTSGRVVKPAARSAP